VHRRAKRHCFNADEGSAGTSCDAILLFVSLGIVIQTGATLTILRRLRQPTLCSVVTCIRHIATNGEGEARFVRMAATAHFVSFPTPANLPRTEAEYFDGV
jgi:hypothetical protein